MNTFASLCHILCDLLSDNKHDWNQTTFTCHQPLNVLENFRYTKPNLFPKIIFNTIFLKKNNIRAGYFLRKLIEASSVEMLISIAFNRKRYLV